MLELINAHPQFFAALYFIPVILNLWAYSTITYYQYVQDMRERNDRFYQPRLTVGSILWKIIGAFCPIINCVLMITNTGFFLDLLCSLFGWLEEVFAIPLVRKTWKPDNNKDA